MRLDDRDRGLYELRGEEGERGDEDRGEGDGWTDDEWDMGTPRVELE